MDEDNIEFISEDDEVGHDLKLEDFGQSVLWGTDWTVETILAQLRRKNIDIIHDSNDEMLGAKLTKVDLLSRSYSAFLCLR